MFRKYLVTIHRFYFKFLPWNKDPSTYVLVVFGSTLAFFTLFILNRFNIIIFNTKTDFILVWILVTIGFWLRMRWYDRIAPNTEELHDGKDAYTGVIVFLISLIMFYFCRV